MEELVSFEQVQERVVNNKVIVDATKSTMIGNSRVIFAEKNNILFIENGVCLENSKITFQGDNAVIYLSKNRHTYLLRVTVYHASTVYVGNDCYINGPMTLIASERQNILIGRDGLFSFGIFMRTADPHLLYDCKTKQRINDSRSILIGDHVWIGQDVLVLKGTQVGSGSVIGGDTVLSGKRIASNVVVCGNPGKVVRRNVFFSSKCVHSWTIEMTENYATMDNDEYIYNSEAQGITLEKIDTELKSSIIADQRLEWIQKFFCNNENKNRFAIKEMDEKTVMNILEVHDVSIRYMTGDFKDIGLKEYVIRKLRGNYHVNEFWADRHISFTLEKGEMLGIIGTNGAGKSTLLKAISGIMEPTRGYVKRKGNIAALLELASGFDGDLTVRENAYLRGAMLGYTRRFMDEKYDEIIDFAELEDFQDRPFKQLSSGMKSRLAFSIASLVAPDILILDEVLSVGDGAFRKKSEEKMREIIASGATTILVSHSIQQVRNMCTKVLWLEKGEQVAFGNEVGNICNIYQQYLDHSITLEQGKIEAKNSSK